MGRVGRLHLLGSFQLSFASFSPGCLGPGNCPGLGKVGALNYGYFCGFDVHDVALCYLVAFRQRQQTQSELPLMGFVWLSFF
jgi:hypothetical protein